MSFVDRAVPFLVALLLSFFGRYCFLLILWPVLVRLGVPDLSAWHLLLGLVGVEGVLTFKVNYDPK